MMTLLLILVFLQMDLHQSSNSAVTQGKNPLKVVDYAGLEAYLAEYADRTVVINFWATWCAPCVKELPFFEQVTAAYNEDELVVVLVSLDFTKQIDSKLKPFLKKHNIQSKVVLLNDPDQNTWIEKVDPEWSGAIPITLIRNGRKSAFYEKTFQSYEELNTVIQSFFNS
jgi:thiol-disulfide isomerase/thioredoxin